LTALSVTDTLHSNVLLYASNNRKGAISSRLTMVKSIASLTFHPLKREVVLRIMPSYGSAPPRILTRLFSGQGTFNVPAWSPDSQAIAFVSYRLDR